MTGQPSNPPQSSIPDQPDHPDYDPPPYVLISGIQSEPVRWLWPERIPQGMLSIIEGDPGLGKTLIALDLAARISRGDNLPNASETRPPMRVLVLNAEDDPGRTLRPRLEAAGAVTDQIAILESSEGVSLDPTGLRRIEHAIQRLDIALVIIDPLMAFLPDGCNPHKDHDVRRVLSPVKALAERTQAAFLLIRHLNKNPDTSAMYRGGGSIGIIGAARAAHVVAEHPANDEQRVLAAIKSNLSPKAPSLSYRLVEASNGHPRVEWLGTATYDAQTLLQRPPQRDGQQQRAEALLRDALISGPMPSADIEALAADEAISIATLRRARRALGIVVTREGYGSNGRFLCSLPACATEMSTNDDKTVQAEPPGQAPFPSSSSPQRFQPPSFDQIRKSLTSSDSREEAAR